MLEVVQQLRYGYKLIGFFDIVGVSVIALASLVVIAHTTFATGAEVKPILVGMPARRQWLCKAPDDDFYNGTVIANFFGSGNWFGIQLYCIIAIYCRHAICLM